MTVTVALTPPPPGNVVITLTPDQVASVLAQAGGTTGVILTPEEIAVLKAIIGRAKKAPPTAPAPMTPATSVDPASVEKLAADLEKFKTTHSAIGGLNEVVIFTDALLVCRNFFVFLGGRVCFGR